MQISCNLITIMVLFMIIFKRVIRYCILYQSFYYFRKFFFSLIFFNQINIFINFNIYNIFDYACIIHVIIINALLRIFINHYCITNFISFALSCIRTCNSEFLSLQLLLYSVIISLYHPRKTCKLLLLRVINRIDFHI